MELCIKIYLRLKYYCIQGYFLGKFTSEEFCLTMGAMTVVDDDCCCPLPTTAVVVAADEDPGQRIANINSGSLDRNLTFLKCD